MKRVLAVYAVFAAAAVLLTAQPDESANNWGFGPEPPHDHEILQHFYADGPVLFTSKTGWSVTFTKSFSMSGDFFAISYDIVETAPPDRPKESKYYQSYYRRLSIHGPPYSLDLASCEAPGVCKAAGTLDKTVVKERLAVWHETDEDGNLLRMESIRTWGMWRAENRARLDGSGVCILSEPGFAMFFGGTKKEDCYQDGVVTIFTVPLVSGTDRDADTPSPEDQK